MREANANKAIDSKPSPPKRRASSSSGLWLIVFLAAAASILCYRLVETKVHRELRIAVHKRFQEAFPAARIAISRVTIEGPDRIAVHGLKIGALDNRKVRNVLTADRVELSGDLDIAHCIQETVQIHKVDIYRPEVNLWKMQNGQWSWTALACVSKSNQPTPTVSVQQGELKIHRAALDESSFVQFHTINGIATKSTARQSHGKNAIESKFTAQCGYCESLNLSGFVDREKGQVVFGGTLEKLNFSADLASKLPSETTALMTKLSGLTCKATALFRVERNDHRAPWTFGVTANLFDGRLNDPQLPYPLDHLSGEIFCDNQSLKLRGVKATSDQTACTLDADIHGFTAQSPVIIRATATDLQLDSRLYNALPAKWRTYWDRVKPDGLVDATLVLKSDGKSWTPVINVHCRDVQLECWLFPYPLTDVHGQVVLRPDNLVGKGLYGKAGGQPIASNFQFQRIEEEWFGNLNITGSGPITIDDKVLNALTTRGQPTSNVEKFVRSLTPSGTFQIDKANFKKIYGEPAYWHKELAISVNDCSMLYRGFQYPLHRISGRIEAIDDQWDLIGFEGWNGTGRIQCNGGWQDKRAEGVPFQLAFTAHGLPLQEELFTALPPDARQLWEQLEPSGSIDRAEISLQRGANEELELAVTLHEDIHTGSTSGQSLRLQPKAFPYLLSDVACDLTYRPGLLEISQASANNLSIRAAIRARCEKNAAGNWAGTVHWLPQSRVTVDTPLLRALPDSISAGLVKLDMRGPVHILGETKFELPVDGVTTPTTELDLSLELEEVQLGDGRNVDNIRGNIRLRGRRDPTQLVATGWANLESMTVRNVPLANVRGPWAIIGNQFVFGSEVASRFQPGPENVPTDLTASALAGVMVASGSGRLDTGRFQLKSRLTDADFRCMLQDLGVTPAPTDAKCNVELAVSGIPWEPQTYSGNGAIHLRDAKLYELPIMIRVLRALSVAPTDKAAFHTADVKFEIDGDQIPLELECNGDLLSLKGNGRTNFRKDLELEVYSYVGGRVPVSSVFAPIVREASYASFMSFHVSGSVDNPIVGRPTLPQFNMMQQIFPDKVADADTPESRSRLLERWRK